MLNTSCVIWNVLVALRDTGGQTEIPAGVNTRSSIRSSCPWNTSTWSSTIGQHQILTCFVLGYLANSLIFTVELDRPVTSVTSPHSWHSLSFQQMSSSYKGQTPANGEPADSVRKSHTSPTLYRSGLYSVKAPELLSGVQWQTQPSNAFVQT